MSVRYFFEIAYNGSSFFGWQIQPNHISVQETIQTCLSKLNSNNSVKIVGCGRTDTGVHAKQYFFHVDFTEIENLEQFKFKLNSMLPSSIAVFSISEVENNKHARFDAKSRTYRYFIHDWKDPFLDNVSWCLYKKLDMNLMNKATSHLIGKMDFTSFSKIHTDVKTNICEVTNAKWNKTSDGQMYFEITADRFLRNMVRAVVGTSVEVGTGNMEPEKIKDILKAKDRQAAGSSAPAQGLFLWKIIY